VSGARRLEASLLTSALLHGLALVLLMRSAAVPDRPALNTIPIALIGRPGGGGGEAGPAPAAPSPPASPPTPTREAAPRPRPPERVVSRTPRRPSPSAPDTAAVAPMAPDGAGSGTPGPGGSGTGGGGSGGGGGDGSGGDGSGGARVAYGANPLPPYPMIARRLGKEGVVLLEVLVAPDGRAADVRLLKSSGFTPLDDSAMTTVRERWRFVPARRGGTPVESRVTVPIRFRLQDEEG
jgi:protein TonB